MAGSNQSLPYHFVRTLITILIYKVITDSDDDDDDSNVSDNEYDSDKEFDL